MIQRLYSLDISHQKFDLLMDVLMLTLTALMVLSLFYLKNLDIIALIQPKFNFNFYLFYVFSNAGSFIILNVLEFYLKLSYCKALFLRGGLFLRFC